jgi:IS5 family transposase
MGRLRLKWRAWLINDYRASAFENDSTSLLYRRFTCFYEDPIPDFSNLCRAFALFGKQGTQQIHQRIVQQATEAAIIAGKKLRTDTTAVETNIHHPTDSSLLADSLRVMSRYLQRIEQGCQEAKLRTVNHARATKHRVLEIGQAARTFTQAGQAVKAKL